MMNVRSGYEGNVLVITPLDSSLDARTVKSFQSAVETDLKRASLVLFDFQHLDYVDSSGIGCTLRFMKAIRERGGDLKIAGLSLPVRRIFDLVGLGRLLEIYDDVPMALDSFQA